MSCDCYISVQFPVNEHTRLTDLAKTMMARYPYQDDVTSVEFHSVEKHLWRFLEDLTDPADGAVYLGGGPKGDVIMWGQIGNYVNIDRFMEDLLEFCELVYQAGDVISGFNRVLVIFQQQDRAAEFYWVGTVDGSGRGPPKTWKCTIGKVTDEFSFGTV